MSATLSAPPHSEGASLASPLARELERVGVVVIPDLLTPDRLRGMQRAFAGRLKRQRWNNVDGYEKTEPYRHMVQDVLTLDQGFVDAALDPRVKEAVREYVGEVFELVEAKGWLSVPTRYDFHGWHGDAWYDQEKVQGIPREVKLGIYLTDVTSGAFLYLQGSHGKQAPRSLRKEESLQFPPDQVAEVTGPAGTAFLFDTSGIHRQAIPILEPRQAVFLNYHDPRVPLQKEDVDYYRYHPLLLNAAFLGNLSAEDRRILGFGNKTHYQADFERAPEHPVFQGMFRTAYNLKLRLRVFRQRVFGRLRRLFRRR
jgi:hypothetical protein